MTTLTMKEVKNFLRNNPSFEDMDKRKQAVEVSDLPPKEKEQEFLRLSWDRAERRDYFKAKKELEKRNREFWANAK